MLRSNAVRFSKQASQPGSKRGSNILYLSWPRALLTKPYRRDSPWWFPNPASQPSINLDEHQIVVVITITVYNHHIVAKLPLTCYNDNCHRPFWSTPFRECMTITQFNWPSFLIHPMTCCYYYYIFFPLCNKWFSVGPWVVTTSKVKWLCYHLPFECMHINIRSSLTHSASHVFQSKILSIIIFHQFIVIPHQVLPKRNPWAIVTHQLPLKHGQRLSNWWPWWLRS